MIYFKLMGQNDEGTILGIIHVIYSSFFLLVFYRKLLCTNFNQHDSNFQVYAMIVLLEQPSNILAASLTLPRPLIRAP
jgi:hypothetical protein